MKPFKLPLALTFIAMAAAFALGGVKDVVLVAVLCILEISLSLDNAVANAAVLRHWSEKWRDRFMTWGLPVAIFGMRLVFPLLIVAIAGHIGFFEAGKMALEAPRQYAQILTSAHHEVSAFGGAFLLMVFFKFMLDRDKDEHWISIVERPLARADSTGRCNSLMESFSWCLVI